MSTDRAGQPDPATVLHQALRAVLPAGLPLLPVGGITADNMAVIMAYNTADNMAYNTADNMAYNTADNIAA